MKRILHTMIRVGDLQKSIDFYTGMLGMQVLRTRDNPQEKYSLTFIGYADEKDTSVIELTYNYGVSKYEMGNAFGHIAISVDDCQAACEELKTKGVEIKYGPRAMQGSQSIIAFICDPDGYQIELIQQQSKT
jgi:lactoylglutathione lyase